MTREELIEVMARAQCSEGGFDPDERMPNDGPRWGYYVPGVEVALSAIEAAGVRLVPVKCTDDMVGYAGARAEARGDIRMLPGEYRGAWEAMLAASPYAPPGS